MREKTLSERIVAWLTRVRARVLSLINKTEAPAQGAFDFDTKGK